MKKEYKFSTEKKTYYMNETAAKYFAKKLGVRATPKCFTVVVKRK